ncbi:MAG TPA: ATP-binding protein [Terriglobales bacterium]|nr:ATP-binding protein [Terriglobales bacterium]
MASPRISALKVTERLAIGITLGESHFREFKSALDRSSDPPKNRDVKLVCRDIAETLVAFANADGGELYVGVEDDGTVSGVHYSDPQFLMLTEAPKTHVHPKTPLPTPTIARVSYEGKTVLYFQIPKSTERVHQTSEGKCVQRFDQGNRPTPLEDVQYSRQEQQSREYDRAFVDGATLQDLDLQTIDAKSKQHFGGQTPEKVLQQMDLAEFGSDGLQLRRAALLLFANDISKWHPRCEVRIVRVYGETLGVGKDYNVLPRDDHTIRGNILYILENAWDTLRPFLIQTKLSDSVIFKETLVYPEDACSEAVTNAVAHRDYSIEGKGVEVLIFDNRFEITSPGGLLSSISIDDLRGGKRTHQSRNAYLARMLRECGYMREMGEGMLRIFTTMRDRDLVPPELEADGAKFNIILRHRSVFTPEGQEWLRSYLPYNLSRDEQRTILFGRDGHLLSTKEIMKLLGMVNVDDFRQLVEHLRRKGILYNALVRGQRTSGALRAAGSKKELGRFAIRPPDQTEQFRQELLTILRDLGPKAVLTSINLDSVQKRLSTSSPFREALRDSLKLLGLVDDRMKPLPQLTTVWQDSYRMKPPLASHHQPPADKGLPATQNRRQGQHVGTINTIKQNGYGFITEEGGSEVFFHVTSLTDQSQWDKLSRGTRVSFEYGVARLEGKPRAARHISIL